MFSVVLVETGCQGTGPEPEVGPDLELTYEPVPDPGTGRELEPNPDQDQVLDMDLEPDLRAVPKQYRLHHTKNHPDYLCPLCFNRDSEALNCRTQSPIMTNFMLSLLCLR